MEVATLEPTNPPQMSMNLQEIKSAIDADKTVHWANDSYVVIKHFPRYPDTPEYLIKCLSNDHCIGLTWKDGVTMNGKEEQFYINV